MSVAPTAAPSPILKVGLSLFAPSGPRGEHLFVVIAGPKVIASPARREWLLASVCSIKPGLRFDAACVVGVGDHPFLSRESYVSYSQLRVDFEDDLNRHIASGYFHVAEEGSSTLVAQMLEGLRASNRVPRFIRDNWP